MSVFLKMYFTIINPPHFSPQILGGLMSLAMIIRVCACPETQLPSFPLSYKPPKYTEVINY